MVGSRGRWEVMMPVSTRRRFLQYASAALAASNLRGAEPDPALAKAMEGVRANIALAGTDPDRPSFHFHPPSNWMNDPNGTIFYRGWHHLFYQLNPFSSSPGNQHWGHARSRDLVNWEHLPIAIWPSRDKGEQAIFSGGAVLADDGRPRLIYTSIGRPEPEQWMMIPKDDDLIAWDKHPKPVLTTAAHGAVRVKEWRDPFLFRENGRTFMVCGGNVAGGKGGTGQVQLYHAAKGDLTEWKHLGPVFRPLERETWNIECPNLFKLDGQWVLIVSPHRPCEYYVGDLDFERVKFTPYCHGILDAGDAYASNISVDEKRRVILWLWGRTNTQLDKGWNSVLVLPRILTIGPDGFLRQTPAPECASLRGDVKEFPSLELGEQPKVIAGIPGDSVEIEAEFSAARMSGAFGFELRRSAEGRPGVPVILEHGTLTVGEARSNVGHAGRYKLRIFLDRRCIEVYVNEGTAAVYNPVHADHRDQGIAAFAKGFPAGSGPRLESLRVWPMKPAGFSLEHFRT